MSAPAQRRSLLPVQAVPSEPLPIETVAAVGARNGFREVEPSETMPAVTSGIRRQRQPTGRDHQFNTRLRRDTLDYIYAEANGRNVPIAQVIEEGMEALKRERLQISKP